MGLSDKITELSNQAEKDLAEVYREIDGISFKNTEKVLNSFRKFRVSDSMFAETTGYGYNDTGRETLDKIYADVFGCESAFVRHNIVNGTQAIAIGLYGLLRPGDVMLSVTDRPYDTLCDVVGLNGKTGDGSLADFGVKYDQVDFRDGRIDYEEIGNRINKYKDNLKVVFIQRSKGYLNRPTLSVEEIGKICTYVHKLCNAYVMVDNCYGEFTEEKEPVSVGADLMAGSLIKNPGGGYAECGGYLAGTEKAVELASYRLTTVGTGCEVGATMGQNRKMYKGFFMAPHAVAQAVKTAHFASYIFEKMGFDVFPKYTQKRYDIIQTVVFGNAEGLISFCKGIQSASPVDSFVVPEPWAMPGYEDKVIMAGGTFTQGSTIELSADGPLRPPYTAFFQGSLSYESGKLAIMYAADRLLKDKE